MAQKLIYAKFSNDRSGRFGIVTKIMREEGRKYVLKEPSNPLAEEHVKQILPNREFLVTSYKDSRIRFARAAACETGIRVEWVKGNSFAEYLDKLLDRGDKEDCFAAMEEYFSQVFSAGVHPYRASSENGIFSDPGLMAGSAQGISGTDIDMLFQNVIYSETDRIWTDYDYEWVFQEEMPVKFLVYRCLLYYLTTEKRIRLLGQEAYDRFGISEEERDIFDRMEARLQDYISGDVIPFWKLYGEMGGMAVHAVPLVERWIGDRKAEIFFDRGCGFSADDSEPAAVRECAPGVFRTVLRCPGDTRVLRFDPAQNACILQIEYLQDAAGRSLDFRTNGIKQSRRKYLFFHNDPQICIDTEPDTRYVAMEYHLCIIDVEEISGQLELEKYQQDTVSARFACEQLTARIAEQESRIAEQESRNAELEARCENQNRQYGELESSHSALQERLAAAEQELQSIRESRGWRFVTSVRKIMRK